MYRKKFFSSSGMRTFFHAPCQGLDQPKGDTA